MRVPAIAALICGLALAGCGAPKPGAFYRQAVSPGAQHGALLAVEPYTPAVRGAAAYRVLYDSEDINGAPVTVSGVVYIPLAPPPAGGRNLVAWAHATTGIAPGCAPSLETGGIGGSTLADSIPGLRDFLAAGDVVAATDYQGMGVPGINPYLVGQAEGQDILDSVRAAQHLPGADLSGKFAVWGHSQGGQAALFAGQLAAGYTPGLDLVGVAAAAPPTDLNGELTEKFTRDSGRLLTAYVYDSWSKVYHVPITSVVDPRAVPVVHQIAGKCIDTLGQAIEAIRAAAKLDAVFLDRKPGETPPWPELFAQNSPGHAPPGAPLLIVQGLRDPTVEPHWTESFAREVCAKHETLEFRTYPGVNHLRIAEKSLPAVEPWIAARFAGQTAPDNCPK
jgi:acetyl esterase/lipase